MLGNSSPSGSRGVESRLFQAFLDHTVCFMAGWLLSHGFQCCSTCSREWLKWMQTMSSKAVLRPQDCSLVCQMTCILFPTEGSLTIFASLIPLKYHLCGAALARTDPEEAHPRPLHYSTSAQAEPFRVVLVLLLTPPGCLPRDETCCTSLLPRQERPFKVMLC